MGRKSALNKEQENEVVGYMVKMSNPFHGLTSRSEMTCKKKWQNLVRTYKSTKDIRSRTGRGPVKFSFYSRLDDILGDLPSNASPHLLDTDNIESQDSQFQSSNVNGDPASPSISNTINITEVSDADARPSTLPAGFSPEIIRPLPKALPRKTRNTRKTRKSAIYTDNPEKNAIQEEYDAQKKKQEKS
ncbi:myb/sant-like dna-binding domain [Holotrichia oblita]|uniref:Myb/sant-like dna-binding domain n=1 Tax=Holotrichia oblita TaxID=644536 RepID=A0ACB9TAC2_HOLOL|nr:myb/sant-like dna-binding domain [Holotrichia oblita]